MESFLHIGKNFEEYLVGTSSTAGIVSKEARQVLSNIASLLSPIREKYRLICLYDQWVKFQEDNNFSCPAFQKAFHSRTVLIIEFFEPEVKTGNSSKRKKDGLTIHLIAA